MRERGTFRILRTFFVRFNFYLKVPQDLNYPGGSNLNSGLTNLELSGDLIRKFGKIRSYKETDSELARSLKKTKRWE